MAPQRFPQVLRKVGLKSPPYCKAILYQFKSPLQVKHTSIETKDFRKIETLFVAPPRRNFALLYRVSLKLYLCTGIFCFPLVHKHVFAFNECFCKF